MKSLMYMCGGSGRKSPEVCHVHVTDKSHDIAGKPGLRKER